MIWIRTQTKEELIECNEFMLCYTITYDEFFFRGHDLIIGKYSTKAKALKVLDMIQEAIENNVIFQMPLDSEVKEDD